MNNSKQIHNIVAGIILAEPIRRLRDDFMTLVRGYLRVENKDEELFRKAEHAARTAMENVLLEDYVNDTNAAVKAAQRSLIAIIERYVPEEGKQLVLNDVTHEQYTASNVYIEHFTRLYRQDTGGDTDIPSDIVVEYSDHIPESRKPNPKKLSGDYIDSFTLDELVEIANALEFGRFTVA